MRVTRTIDETRDALAGHGPVALVPTMGALHAGHVALIDRARELCPRVAVSIFVNPTQFGPGEDLARYPRPIERDLAMCGDAGVDLVFNPPPEVMYPPGEPEMVIDVPPLTRMLEGAYRRGHFIGVCRVVAKLLNIVQPRVACFGMKDYQQLAVVRAMVAGMCMPIQIEACPTLREPDGLAMSSRNIYLASDHRPGALGLITALRRAEQMIRSGEAHPAAVETAMLQIIHDHGFAVDYAVVRDARTLAEVDAINAAAHPVVCLVAGKFGGVRLIDNILIGPDGGR